MSSTAIRIQNLGKLYRIGPFERYKTLRETVTAAVYAPFHSARSALNGARSAVGESAEDHIWALKDVSFEVKKGEVVGIIGRNGAGKTTLLKILSRITEPTQGSAEIYGRIGLLLEVGTGFHPELTGRENVYLNGAILGMKKREIEGKFDEIVSFAEVEKFVDTPVKRYSSGMHMRLAFAVAAYLEPDILLVDEVLAVGDAVFQKKCLGKMGDVAREGRTILFVSHNLQIVNQLCPHSILLDKGSLVANDRTNVILDLYTEAMAPSETSNDLSNPDLRSPDSLENSLFKWTNIKILNSEQKINPEIRFGEPFEIILSGIAAQECKYFRVGFGIINRLTGVVFNSHHIFDGSLDTLAEGVATLRIEINPNILAPGFYSINIGAVGYHIIDQLLDCFGFRVQEIGLTPARVWDPSYKRGVVDLPWCKWRVIKN